MEKQPKQVFSRRGKPTRKEARSDIDQLTNKFVDFFSKKGYIQHKPVLISSGIDPTIHFIGSHISVFKPYFISEQVPSPGYHIVQRCIRTQNLKLYPKNSDFNWASFFISMGLLVPFNRLNQLSDEVIEFLTSTGIPLKDIRIRIFSKDEDLMKVCKNKTELLEIDTKPEKYYRHKLGFNHIFGRNYNIAIRMKDKDEFADVGNVIIIEKDGKPISVELALGTSTIVRQVYGLKHIMDCFDINGLENKDQLMRRKIEDAILVTSILYEEGLRPGKKGKHRILSEYVKTISYFRQKLGLSMEKLSNVLKGFETSEFPEKKENINHEIIDYINRFEKKTKISNQFSQRFENDTDRK